jgi:hypothetical protein
MISLLQVCISRTLLDEYGMLWDMKPQMVWERAAYAS